MLKVGSNALTVWTGWEFFYGKMMGKNGRILISKLKLALLRGGESRRLRYGRVA